jgi:hypothetical protein
VWFIIDVQQYLFERRKQSISFQQPDSVADRKVPSAIPEHISSRHRHFFASFGLWSIDLHSVQKTENLIRKKSVCLLDRRTMFFPLLGA